MVRSQVDTEQITDIKSVTRPRRVDIAPGRTPPSFVSLIARPIDTVTPPTRSLRRCARQLEPITSPKKQT